MKNVFACFAVWHQLQSVRRSIPRSCSPVAGDISFSDAAGLWKCHPCWHCAVPSQTTAVRAGCRNARLTARLGNRELTVTARLTCGRVARSKVSKPSG